MWIFFTVCIYLFIFWNSGCRLGLCISDRNHSVLFPRALFRGWGPQSVWTSRVPPPDQLGSKARLMTVVNWTSEEWSCPDWTASLGDWIGGVCICVGLCVFVNVNPYVHVFLSVYMCALLLHACVLALNYGCCLLSGPVERTVTDDVNYWLVFSVAVEYGRPCPSSRYLLFVLLTTLQFSL